MNRKRSISEIVAVVMLIIVAISASILLYVWLNGLVG
ncbi:MAG: archaellin/type IV pilin N-terminal domain-containing protein [Caldisphaera sp.]